MYLSEIYRYPVKGLSPQKLLETQLTPGETIACDRIYAIENGHGRFDPNAPKYLPKINFLMLMRHERLAALKTVFDEETHMLTIYRDDKQVAKGDLSSRIGRQMIEQFFSAYKQNKLKGPPKIVSADNHSFSDVAAKCLHIINLNTVRDLERRFNCKINPLRFRANCYIDDVPAWEEFDWVDKSLQIGEGEVHVFDRTERCDATNVDPETGARDLTIPPDLMRAFGHNDVGVYAKVTKGGLIKEGDKILVGS